MERAKKITAVKNKDKNFDGVFYVGVKSTKIVCKPSCPSRTPLEKNMEFFDTVETAVEMGYRPCRRCKPHVSEMKSKE